MNMIINIGIFCLPLLIFTYWNIIGYAVLSLLRGKRNSLQNILLAPVTGFALTLLFVFTLNRAGLAVVQFALPLSLMLLVSAIITFIMRRPILPLKPYLPFIGIFILALFLTGRPLLNYGLNWISYANDDMTNYSLAALRFLHHGFFDVPPIDDILSNKDYSLQYWFMYVPAMIRPGSELILAWISAITHVQPLSIFMPTILALHLVLISTVGALVCIDASQRRMAQITCLLVSFSALTALGTLYSLIAQVSGLSLLIAASLVLLQPFSQHRKYGAAKDGILIALIMASLLIVYPEIFPFLAIAFVIYFSLHVCRSMHIPANFFISISIALVTTLLILNIHTIPVIDFLLAQLKVATIRATTNTVIFPYYLLPSGLANLWGLQALTNLPSEPWMSLSIIWGGILTIIITMAAIVLLPSKNRALAVITLVMMAMSINLFLKSSGFGLFKLAMFIQPFILAVFAITLLTQIKTKRTRMILLIIMLVSSLPTLNFYVTRSKSITPGSFSEILFASNTGLMSEYKKLLEQTPADAVLFSDDFNISLIKLQAHQSRNHCFTPLVSPISFLNIYNSDKESAKRVSSFFHDFRQNHFDLAKADTIRKQMIVANAHMRLFNLQKANDTPLFFIKNKEDKCGNNAILITNSSMRCVFNRSHASAQSKQNFYLQPLRAVKNHLVMIDSSLGSTYWSQLTPENTPRSLYNLESDPMYPGRTMQAMGRYLLFRAIHPTEQVRLALALTDTFNGDGNNQLPQTAIIGKTRQTLPLVGRGSARVFSEPLTPQMIEGIPYFVIDMNQDGKIFQHKKNGLMNLYNRNIQLDSRFITAFIRNISLISNDEYQHLNPPVALNHFPDDLATNELAYSGLYEDGWVSEHSYYVLHQPATMQELVIRGIYPKLLTNQPETTITVLLDGKKLVKQQLVPGDFKLKLPVTSVRAHNHKIELIFSNHIHLPNGDDRPVAAQLAFIGFMDTHDGSEIK